MANRVAMQVAAMTCVMVSWTITLSAYGQSSGQETMLLRAETKTLNLTDPESDLRAQIAAKYYRFIGVSGIAFCAPRGLTNDHQYDLVHKHGIRCIAGTGDVIESAEHRFLMDQVIRYATTYNVALAKHLGGPNAR